MPDRNVDCRAHKHDALQRLKRFRTPIVYDAIERFAVRPKSDGYTDPSIRSILPEFGPLVGHAVTAKTIGEFPLAPGEHHLTFRQVWEHFWGAGPGSVAVVQDIDTQPGRASAWGDVSVAIFKRLGCLGVLTNGSVRDVPDIAGMNFGLFASGLSVGHGNVRYVAIDTPVRIGGLEIHPGNLLHMDDHGAMIVPDELDLDAVAHVADEILKEEAALKHYCSSPDFDFRKLDEMHTSSMGGSVED